MTKNFRRIGFGVDVRPLTQALNREEALWREVTLRQDLAGSPHKDTECIFLRWCADQSLEAAFTDLEAVDYPALLRIPEFRSAIGYVAGEVEGRRLGRAIVTKLKAHGSIDLHADEGDYADHYERFHLILKSDGECKFHCGLEEVSMMPGELWWFDHKKEHMVINHGDQERIHLIVDVVAPNYRQERHAISA